MVDSIDPDCFWFPKQSKCIIKEETNGDGGSTDPGTGTGTDVIDVITDAA